METTDQLGAASTALGDSRSAPSGSEHDAVAIGDCLGRYTVRAHIGSGGMGDVFEGHDPELDRDVALKVLKPELGGSSPESRARFQREAQAMARLNHPNVVVVYDVGTVGDRVFVAMELVRGPTLAEWIAQRRHTWREVVDIFLQAGRGLEAAHAADIVHRDFKPRNVILGDRVRVADFGLARSFGEIDPEVTTATSSVLDQTITQTGHRVGTPKYMAPEQRDGLPVTALADQFAFCVALEEALAGASTPRSIRSLVARGRQPDPEQRYPSMTALLADLDRDRATPRRIAVAAAGLVVLVGAGVVVHARGGEPPCADPTARLAGVWDAERKGEVHAAFLATRLGYAEDSWRTVEAALDGYTGKWTDMALETCRATRIDGRQSEALMDLRMTCLDRRRSVLADVTTLWAHGMDADAVEHAPDAATKLTPLAECADARALSERPVLPIDPVEASRVTVARSHLDEVQALTLAHRWPEGRTRADAVRAEADATGWAPVRAEAAFAQGSVLYELGDPLAEPRLLDAAQFSAEARDEQLQAQALVLLINELARISRQGERALLVARIADGLVTRLGDPALEAQYLRHLATALEATGKLDDAAAALKRALPLFKDGDPQTLSTMRLLADLAETQGNYAESLRLAKATVATTTTVFGAEHPRVARALVTLANAHIQLGDYDAGVEAYRHALLLMEKSAGPDATTTGQILSGLGAAELMRDHVADARVALERALAILERTTGPDSALVAVALDNLSQVRILEGRRADAIAVLERALAIKTKLYGPVHADLINALQNLAAALEQNGDRERALTYYRRAVDVATKALGADHPTTLEMQGALGAAFARQHRCGDARPWLAMSIAGLSKTDPPVPDLATILSGLALCDLAAGHPADAEASLARALGILAHDHIDGDVTGPIRHLEAEALWALGRRDEALAAARKAAVDLAVSPMTADDLAANRVWIAAHAGTGR